MSEGTISPFSPLMEKLGYTFKNESLLELALTHSSYRNEMKSKGEHCECNERLEFLGDSVVSLVVSEHIYEKFSSMPEGELSRIRAGVVCERALASYSTILGVGEFMLLGKGEASTNGRTRASTLEDAFEAIIAAVYLDGGFEEAKKIVLRFTEPEIKRLLNTGRTTDHKTILQQFVQKEHGDILEYVLTAEIGPPHDRTFKVEARLNNNVIGRGTGHSKREAEQHAAAEALILFGAKNEDK